MATTFFSWLLKQETKKRGLVAGLVKSYKDRLQARLLKEAAQRKAARAEAARVDAARAASAAAGSSAMHAAM